MEKTNLSTLTNFSGDKFTRSKVFAGKATQVLLLCLEPGQSVPAHSHLGFEVTLQGLEGEVTLPGRDGERFHLRPGELCFADGAEEFAPRNESAERAQVLIHLVRHQSKADGQR